MIFALDCFILDRIQEVFQSDISDTLMPFITSPGNKGLLWILLTLMLSCVKKYRKTALTLAIALIFSLIIGNLLLKPLVARNRPFEAIEFSNLLIPAPRDFSFPSGHAMSSFAAASALLPKHKQLGIPAMILASLIAFSRLYLYVHYLSDVLAGILPGILCGTLAKKSLRFF